MALTDPCTCGLLVCTGCVGEMKALEPERPSLLSDLITDVDPYLDPDTFVLVSPALPDREPGEEFYRRIAIETLDGLLLREEGELPPPTSGAFIPAWEADRPSPLVSGRDPYTMDFDHSDFKIRYGFGVAMAIGCSPRRETTRFPMPTAAPPKGRWS